ncbi:MAG: FG-GAP repeat protein, partial [Anaerolineales bacterium]|nr:FG-GAP repeat protein [Anaerolineales bacterium]
DGNLALIGAPEDDDNGTNSGSAYIYRFDGSSWQEEAKLLPRNGDTQDNFGRSVDIRSDGNTVIVGTGRNEGSPGFVSIYKFIDGEWIEKTKLMPPSDLDYSFFGLKCLLSDGNILITYYTSGHHEVSIYSISAGSQDSGDEYVYNYGIGNNLGTQHGTFMQLDWHDTAGGGFLDDVDSDEMYLVQDVVRNVSDMSEKDTDTSGGQICSIDFAGSFAPILKYQNIFNEEVGGFFGTYPQLTEGAITIGCHTPSSSTPDFTFPYRAPFFLMDYYKDSNTHYQPMGFFVDNMSDSGSFYRTWTTHVPAYFDPYAEVDPIGANQGACCMDDDTCYKTSQEICGAKLGTYLGDYVDCEACTGGEVTGACCVGGQCSVITADACGNISGGQYLGDYSNCDNNPCGTGLTGACCYGACGSSPCCDDTENEAWCNACNGDYFGDNTTCEQADCSWEDTGACCVDGEDCYMTTELNCDEAGGTWHGSTSNCNVNDPCNPSDCFQ